MAFSTRVIASQHTAKRRVKKAPAAQPGPQAKSPALTG